MLNNENRRLEIDPVEQLLGSFTPLPAKIDRDQLMFQAGLRAGQAATVKLPSLTLRARLWPALAVVSTAAAIVMAAVLWQRPERVVLVERPAVPAPADPVKPQKAPDKVVLPQLAISPPSEIDPLANYLLQRDRVLRDGPDALANAVFDGGSYTQRAAPTQRQLFQELPGEFRRQTYQVDSSDWWQPWLISGDRS